MELPWLEIIVFSGLIGIASSISSGLGKIEQAIREAAERSAQKGGGE